jgi:hypothetical protein
MVFRGVNSDSPASPGVVANSCLAANGATRAARFVVICW